MGKHNAAGRYLREIKSWLPCGGRMKRDVLEKIEGTIGDFLGENPDADYSAIVARFGTPQQIASSYVDEMETAELLNNLRIRRKIVRIVGAVAAAVVVLWLGVVTLCLAYNVNNDNGFYTVEIDTGTADPMN